MKAQKYFYNESGHVLFQIPEMRGKEMVIDTRNINESKPHGKPRGVFRNEVLYFSL
jgi:hypothetical protein